MRPDPHSQRSQALIEFALVSPVLLLLLFGIVDIGRAVFYYDTVNFNQGALKLAIDFAGADHILAGSDYPHQIGSIPLMLEAVNALPVTEEQREGIRWRNAARILGLEGRVDR